MGSIKKTVRLGVLCSSFDPVTNVHLKMIEEAKRRFQLDNVILLLSSRNIHEEKGRATPLHVRLLMMRLVKDHSIALTNANTYDARARLLVAPNTELYFIGNEDTLNHIIESENTPLTANEEGITATDNNNDNKNSNNNKFFDTPAHCNHFVCFTETIDPASNAGPQIHYLKYPDGVAVVPTRRVRDEALLAHVPLEISLYIQKLRLFSLVYLPPLSLLCLFTGIVSAGQAVQIHAAVGAGCQ